MSTSTWFIVGVATAVIVGGAVSVLRRRSPSSRLRTQPGQSIPAPPSVGARAAAAPTPDTRQACEETPSEAPTAEDELRSRTRSLGFDAVAAAVTSQQQPPSPQFSEQKQDQRPVEPLDEPAPIFCPAVTARPSSALSADLMTHTTLVVEESVEVRVAGAVPVSHDAEPILVADPEALSIVPGRCDDEDASPDAHADIDSGGQDAVLQVNAEDAALDQVQPAVNMVADVVSAATMTPAETAEASLLAPAANDAHSAIAAQDGEADLDTAVTPEEVVGRPAQRTVYRDRRGIRRARTSPARIRNNGRQSNVVPADVSLRLSLHPIQLTCRDSSDH